VRVQVYGTALQYGSPLPGKATLPHAHAADSDNKAGRLLDAAWGEPHGGIIRGLIDTV